MDRFGIGGNNPPDPIRDAPQISRKRIVIWDPLQELKEEAQSPAPDAARIEAAIGRLSSALKTGTLWCLGKVDLAVETAIKWAIPAVAGGYGAVNPDTLELVIGSAERLLALLK